MAISGQITFCRVSMRLPRAHTGSDLGGVRFGAAQSSLEGVGSSFSDYNQPSL